MQSETIIERLLRQSVPEPNSGCLLWLGGFNTITGYGYIKINRKTRLVHRASYEAFKGLIPDALQIRHTCDVPCCINPDHLLVGTQKENMGDMISRGRKVVKPGSAHWKSKVTESDIPVIRARREAGDKLQDIADDYGMGIEGIHNICSRRVWKHVP